MIISHIHDILNYEGRSSQQGCSGPGTHWVGRVRWTGVPSDVLAGGWRAMCRGSRGRRDDEEIPKRMSPPLLSSGYSRLISHWTKRCWCGLLPHKWRLHDVMFWGLFDDNTQNMIHTKAHVRRRQTLPPECGPWGAPREYRPRRRHSYDVSGRTRRRPSNMAWDYTLDRPSAGRPPTDESLTETTLK